MSVQSKYEVAKQRLVSAREAQTAEVIAAYGADFECPITWQTQVEKQAQALAQRMRFLHKLPRWWPRQLGGSAVKMEVTNQGTIVTPKILELTEPLDDGRTLRDSYAFSTHIHPADPLLSITHYSDISDTLEGSEYTTYDLYSFRDGLMIGGGQFNKLRAESRHARVKEYIQFRGSHRLNNERPSIDWEYPKELYVEPLAVVIGARIALGEQVSDIQATVNEL